MNSDHERQSAEGFAQCCGRAPEVTLTTIPSDASVRVVEAVCETCGEFAHARLLDECRVEWNRKRGTT